MGGDDEDNKNNDKTKKSEEEITRMTATCKYIMEELKEMDNNNLLILKDAHNINEHDHE